MNGLNRVMLLGNLGADPELKVTQGGQSVLKLRIATSESWLDDKGQKQERTEWHSVDVWGKRAEGLGKILTKGERIFVEGKLQTRSYDKNGEKRYATNVVGHNVLLMGRGGSTSPGMPTPAKAPSDPADEYGPPPPWPDDIPF